MGNDQSTFEGNSRDRTAPGPDNISDETPRSSRTTKTTIIEMSPQENRFVLPPPIIPAKRHNRIILEKEMIKVGPPSIIINDCPPPPPQFPGQDTAERERVSSSDKKRIKPTAHSQHETNQTLHNDTLVLHNESSINNELSSHQQKIDQTTNAQNSHNILPTTTPKGHDSFSCEFVLKYIRETPLPLALVLKSENDDDSNHKPRKRRKKNGSQTNNGNGIANNGGEVSIQLAPDLYETLNQITERRKTKKETAPQKKSAPHDRGDSTLTNGSNNKNKIETKNNPPPTTEIPQNPADQSQPSRKRGRPKKIKPNLQSTITTPSSQLTKSKITPPKPKAKPKRPVKVPETRTPRKVSSKKGPKLRKSKKHDLLGPFQAIDDSCDLAYRCASAKLRAGDFCGAIRFYGKAIQQLYSEADQAHSELQNRIGDHSQNRNRLLLVRTTIAGMWCSLVRVCLEISDQAADIRKKMNRKRHAHHLEQSDPLFNRFSNMGLDELDNLRVVLFDMSLVLLWKASSCCLVGNHAWLGISYSRMLQGWLKNVAQSVGANEFLSKDNFEARSINAALQICNSSIVPSKKTIFDSDTHCSLDRKRIDLLWKCGVLDSESEEVLMHANVCTSSKDEYIVGDEESQYFLKEEIEKLQKVDDHVVVKEQDDRGVVIKPIFLISSTITCLPVLTKINDGEIYLSNLEAGSNKINTVGESEEKEEVGGQTNSSAAPDDEKPESKTITNQDVKNAELSDKQLKTDIMEVITQPSGHGDKCFGIEYHDKSTGPSDIFTIGHKKEIWDLPTSTTPNQTQKGSDKSVLEVNHLCGICEVQSFPSICKLKEHKKGCRRVDKDKPVVDDGYVPFGEVKIHGDSKMFSFDPEEGRGEPLEELIQVLDYSVEFFEATKDMVVKCGDPAQPINVDVPSFSGQIGLRCQYCTLFGLCHETESYIFPPSTKELNTAMWSLCLTHLDKCQQQPRQIRQMHREFRERISLGGEPFIEYWQNVAKDLQIGNRRGRGGIYWRS